MSGTLPIKHSVPRIPNRYFHIPQNCIYGFTGHSLFKLETKRLDGGNKRYSDLNRGLIEKSVAVSGTIL